MFVWYCSYTDLHSRNREHKICKFLLNFFKILVLKVLVTFTHTHTHSILSFDAVLY